MHRLWLAVPLFVTGCSVLNQSSVLWLSPRENGVVTGTVELRVQALVEPTPANVMFYIDDEPHVKAYSDDGVYVATWNAQEVTAGEHTVTAKPFGLPGVSTTLITAKTIE